MEQILVVIHAIFLFPQYRTSRLTGKPDSASAKPFFIVAKRRKGNDTEYGTQKYRIIMK